MRSRKCPSKNLKIPQQIRDILDDETNASVITWLPHGKGFRIVNRQKFIKQFTPDPWKRYSVFTRHLVKWNFVLIERGRDSGSFYNELFQRDQPELQETMKCCESKRVCILAPRIPKETTLRKKSMPLTNEQMMETILRKKRSSLDLAKVRLKNSLAYSQNQSQQQHHQQQQLGSHRQGQNTFTTLSASSNMSLSELSQPQDKMTQRIVSAAVRALACFEKAGPSNNGGNNIASDTNTENNQNSDDATPITPSNKRSSTTFSPLSGQTGTLNLNPNTHSTSTNTTTSARPFDHPPPFKMPNTNLIGTARKISGISLGFNGMGNGHQVPLGELLAQRQKERQLSLSLSASFAGAANYTNQGIMQYIRSRSMKHILLTAPAVPSDGGINSNNMMDHTPSNMDFGR